VPAPNVPAAPIIAALERKSLLLIEFLLMIFENLVIYNT